MASSMNDSTLWLLALLVVAILFWLVILWPKEKEARAERERRAAEEAERLAVERARLRSERDELLRTIRDKAPEFILKSRLDFEREYRTKGGEGFLGQEMSPLVCFGYRVGKTNGRTERERHAILEYAIVADLDEALPFLPVSYRKDWGEPLSITRFDRIHTHINNMASLREGRHNFEVAVSDWRADATWFYTHQRVLVEKFRAI